MKRALISVFDKTNILSLAHWLVSKNVEIISTGGTYRYLKENHIPVVKVSDVTGFNEMLDGRVKTLHPMIHGGILARRDQISHMQDLINNHINPIDFVVVNLYPFAEKLAENLPFDELIEFIDIGGPSMLRSAAKSFKDVVVLSDQQDYTKVMQEIDEQGELSFASRKSLAAKVFNLTSHYDALISQYLMEDKIPDYLTLTYQKNNTMRYGENAHQQAFYYVDQSRQGAMNNFVQLGGKDLSFNNVRDMDLAWKVVSEFNENEIVCCAVKHSTPCGVALGDSVLTAYIKTVLADSVSIFGGIVAFNHQVDAYTALELTQIFLEIVIAPSFTQEALDILREKKNLRIIQCQQKAQQKWEMIQVDGGILMQQADQQLLDNLEQVTKAGVTEKQKEDLIFALKVAKFVKSNAIVVAKDGQTLGIGGGEVSRIWAAEKALERAQKFAEENVVMASDAFFPFADVVELAAKNNVTAIIQPGGSIRDKDVIKVADENNIAMLFSHIRHFKH